MVERGFAAQALKLVVGIILLGAALELLASLTGLPRIPAIARGFNSLWVSGTLQHDIEVSSARWLTGWLIGSGAGIMLGLATGRSKIVAVGLEGFLILCRAIPFISIVPLFLRLFGLSEAGKILLVAWASAGVCWVAVHQTSRNIAPHLLWRAKSLGASSGRWFWRVLLPSCHDGIYSALRTSLSLGLIVIAVAELGGVYERSSGLWWSEGLGYRLFRSLDEARDDRLLATILTFAAVGIAVDFGFTASWFLGRKLSFRIMQKRVLRVTASLNEEIVSQRVIQNGEPLEVTGLRAAYDGNPVFGDVTFQIPAGRTLSVVGPSGCGKTTLIRAIAHLRDEEFLASGEVRTGETRIVGPSTHVGIVMQEAPVFEHMTVWHNVTFGDKANTEHGRRRCWEILGEFGLRAFATQRARTLSGGQRQRVALATALANSPRLLLLDEPFGALDAITRRRLQRFFWDHVHGKITAVFVTHDPEEAILIGDRVMVGVGEKRAMIASEKNGIPIGKWEFGDEFARLRIILIKALEQTSFTELSDATAARKRERPASGPG